MTRASADLCVAYPESGLIQTSNPQMLDRVVQLLLISLDAHRGSFSNLRGREGLEGVGDSQAETGDACMFCKTVPQPIWQSHAGTLQPDPTLTAPQKFEFSILLLHTGHQTPTGHIKWC